jgi:hypothetical protein
MHLYDHTHLPTSVPADVVVCNPYGFFGQPQIWPRGYPLEHIKGVPSCTNFSRQDAQPLILQVQAISPGCKMMEGQACNANVVCLHWRLVICRRIKGNTYRHLD